MKKAYLHALVVSLAGTSMIKISYNVSNIYLLVCINIVLLGGAIYVYKNQDKITAQKDEKQKEWMKSNWQQLQKIMTEEFHLLQQKEMESREKNSNRLVENLSHIEEKMDVQHNMFQGYQKCIGFYHKEKQEQAEVLRKQIEKIEMLLEKSLSDMYEQEKENGEALEREIQELQSITKVLKEHGERGEKIRRVLDDAVEQMADNQERVQECIDDLESHIQRDLRGIKGSIENLGELNGELAQKYERLWKEIGRNLAETTYNNDQLLILLQDHYKTLKGLADAI
jgi:chromosome segregation ATPase